jgi:nicotinate-nucleotide adenylyltransferase
MKRVALIGGSFDPVHCGHLAMGHAALDQLGVDEVWFIPSAITPLKSASCTPAKIRLSLLKKALKNEPRFKICDVDLKRSGQSYTVDTLKILKQRYPDVEWTWILGADQAQQFHLWKDPEELLKLARFAAVEREGSQIGEAFEFEKLHMDPVAVSSSEIRQGKKLNFLPPEVLQGILDNELYLYFWVKNQMSAKRFAHSSSVARLCRELAKAHGLDEHKAFLAGLFHDIAKDMPYEEQEKWMKACFEQLMSEPRTIWHGYVGSETVKRIFGITDPCIVNAIACHVKGTSYDPVAMIVYIADKLDPLRGYDSRPMIEACKLDLYNGFMMVKAQNKAYLDRTRKVSPAESARKQKELNEKAPEKAETPKGKKAQTKEAA